MRQALVLLILLVTTSCAGPEPGDTGYVVLDPAARSAGLAVDTGDGTGPHSSSLPIAVSASDGATLVGSGLRAPLVVAPGETVEVRGARGTLVRGTARTDRLMVSGSPEVTDALAEMLGARVVRHADGRVELVGDDVLFAAALYGDVAGIDAVSVLLSGAAAESDAPWALGATPAEAALLPVSEGSIGARSGTGQARATNIDPASVVGLYETAGASLLVDAAGGYLLSSAGVQVRGRWSVGDGGLLLVPNGQSSGATITVTTDAGELRDESSGLVLRPAATPSYPCRIPREASE